MLIKPLPEDDEGMNRKRKEKEERKKLNEFPLRSLEIERSPTVLERTESTFELLC